VPKLVGDVVETWGRIASDRKTVVFACSVAHSIALKMQFEACGIKAAHIDGTTPKDERDEVLRALSRGDIQVVCNCMVLTEGWDQPDVSCCVLARPTKSIVMYLQMAGRVLRPWPEKEDAYIIDHSGAVYEHGFIEEFGEWALEPSHRQVNPVQERRKKVGAEPIVCKECSYTFVGRAACPACGHEIPRRGRNVETMDAQLGLVNKAKREAKKTNELTTDDKQRWYRELLGIAQRRDYQAGWAAHKFLEKVGHWPARSYSREPLSPGPEVLRWVKSRQIAYAKAREKQQLEAAEQ
jgi:DNA repair protein RadD